MLINKDDISQQIRPVNSLEATSEIPTKKVVADFLRMENSLVSSIETGVEALTAPRFELDTTYDSELDIALANGWQKAAAIGALFATDPLTLVPIGGAAIKAFQAGNILKGAAMVGGVAAAAEVPNEAILHANQITRTIKESVYNVGGAALLAGVLGGALGTLSKADFRDFSKNLEAEYAGFPTDEGMSTVGAQQKGTTLSDEEIEGLANAKKFFKYTPDFLKSPVWESAVSPSLATRRLNEELADLSLVRKKNTDFTPTTSSVETRIKSYDALRVPFYEAEGRLYNQYKKRIKETGVSEGERLGTGPDGSLTRQEFNEQVWWAGISNDTHIVPEVQELSRTARSKVFDPVLKRSEEVGLMDNIDEIDIKTADTWMKRMYDTDKIKSQRNEFKNIVMEDLKEKRAKSQDKLDEIIEETGFDDADFIKLEELNDQRRAFRKENISKINKEDPKTLAKLKEIDDELRKVAGRLPDEAELKDIQRLMHRTRMLDEELDEIAEQLIDRITNQTGGRLPYNMRVESKARGPQKLGKRGSAKSRVWDIEDKKISDFLIKDTRAIVESHLRTMAPDNELMDKFGSLDFDLIKKQIQDDYSILRNKKVKDKKTGELRKQTNKELKKLSEQMTKDIKNIEGMWEKLRGTFAQPDDYAAPQHVLERLALSLNFVRLLGDVVASSVPDIGRHIMVNGFAKNYGGLVKGLIKDFKGFKMAAEEMKEMGLALDITNSMTALRRANMDEHVPITGKVDEVMDKTSNAFALATGINHWNSAQKTFAGVVTQNRMLSGIEQFAKTGKLSKKEIQNLASHGIGREEARLIAEQFKKFGESREGVKIANAREWDNSKVRNIFRDAIRKQVDEIIVTPGLDRPLWMSKPGWRTIAQFKSFSFSSTQRVMLSGMQQADARTFAGVSVMTMLGMLTYAWKNTLAGRELSDDPRVWVSEGVDRSGITGIFMDVNNVVEKATRGTIGVNSLLGGAPMSRYASRNVTGALLGPSLGLSQDLFKLTGALATGDVRQTDVHALRRILPGQNLPYVRNLFDKAEEGINESFGLK
jgi:hypothetical protein